MDTKTDNKDVIKTPVHIKQDHNDKGPSCGYSIRESDGTALTGWGAVTMRKSEAEHIALCINQHQALTERVERLELANACMKFALYRFANEDLPLEEIIRVVIGTRKEVAKIEATSKQRPTPQKENL